MVERASGRLLPAYVREHVLAPLGLTRTVFTVDGRPEVVASPHLWEYGEVFGPGAMHSTARDLLRYLELYRSGGAAGSKRPPPSRR